LGIGFADIVEGIKQVQLPRLKAVLQVGQCHQAAGTGFPYAAFDEAAGYIVFFAIHHLFV
jgi:hypothetical protein